MSDTINRPTVHAGLIKRFDVSAFTISSILHVFEPRYKSFSYLYNLRGIPFLGSPLSAFTSDKRDMKLLT